MFKKKLKKKKKGKKKRVKKKTVQKLCPRPEKSGFQEKKNTNRGWNATRGYK